MDLASAHSDAEAAMAAMGNVGANECYIREGEIKFLLGQVRREGREYWWVLYSIFHNGLDSDITLNSNKGV